MHGSERREQIIRQIQESKARYPEQSLLPFIVSAVRWSCRILHWSGQQDMRSYLQTAAIYWISWRQCAVYLKYSTQMNSWKKSWIRSLTWEDVDNVMIHHRVYGKMEAELALSSRRKVGAFMEDIRSGKSSPLKNITSNYHYHKVSADSEETLDLIEQELREKGFLVEERRQAV